MPDKQHSDFALHQTIKRLNDWLILNLVLQQKAVPFVIGNSSKVVGGDVKVNATTREGKQRF